MRSDNLSAYKSAKARPLWQWPEGKQEPLLQVQDAPGAWKFASFN